MNIDKQRSIIDAASVGPWRIEQPEDELAHMGCHVLGGRPCRTIWADNHPGMYHEVALVGHDDEPNATFIAAAREEWPKALDSEDALGKALDDTASLAHHHAIHRKPFQVCEVSVCVRARVALAAWRSR